MRLDALESSHPIHVQVNHPDEIGEQFDDISYKKGEFIIPKFSGNVILKFIFQCRSLYNSDAGQLYR